MSPEHHRSADRERIELRVRFNEPTMSAANRAAGELKQLLGALIGPDGSIDIVKTDQSTQDMGSTLVLILGTPAILAVAKGIHDYIAKRGSRVTIETPEGRVIAIGDAAKNIDVAKTVEAIRN